MSSASSKVDMWFDQTNVCGGSWASEGKGRSTQADCEKREEAIRKMS